MRRKTKIWYTADGRDVQVRQMSDEHIHSCLRLIRERMSQGRMWRTRYYNPLFDELERRKAVAA